VSVQIENKEGIVQIGKAFYCNCGVEIPAGFTHCSECDPVNGGVEISYWFVAKAPSDAPAELRESQPVVSSGKPWWKFW